MSYYFLVSSALVKRYLVERGTSWVRRLVAPERGHALIIAQITPVEIVSATMRQQREGRLTVHEAQLARLLIDRHVRHEYVAINMTDRVIHDAEDLLALHPLRAYDAIQLASALEAQARFAALSTLPFIFVSADQRLLTVATARGLVTDDPNLHL